MPLSPLTLLAFGFLSPWLLWGLLLGGLPILIHLMHKRKYKETHWAAMRFLLEAARKNSRRIRLEQLLLLIVRILIVVFIVLAVAQPFVETMGSYFEAEIPTHRIIVVDASFSMNYQSGGEPLFDSAKEMARQIAEAANRGDAFNLIRIRDSEPRTVIRQPAYDSQSVVEVVEQMRPTEESGDIVATLKTVAEVVDDASAPGRKEITIITDLQSENWSPAVAERRAVMQKSLQDLSRLAKLIFVDIGKPGAQNAAVTEFAATEPFVAVEREVSLDVTVRNFGIEPLAGHLLELYVDGLVSQTKRINVAAGSETPVRFTHTFSRADDHRLEARLQRDDLPLDNHRWLALPVKADLKVLLINGVHAGTERETATFYLQRALSPSTATRIWRGFIKPDVISEGELPGVELSRYDCVFLCNVALLTDRESELLHSYVENGGSLVISLGDQVQAENYNVQLFRDGDGLLPAELGNRVGQGDSANEFFFDPANFEHPIVREFEGNPGTGLETTLTYQYVRGSIAESGNAKSAMKFSSGDPAIIDMPFGRGRTLLITTSLDEKWGLWPISPSFPPLMNEIVLHAVSRRANERQLLVRQPMTRTFPTRAFNMSATVKAPDKEHVAVSMTDSDGFSRLAYDQTTNSGLYELALGQPLNRTELFAVNIDARESDLTKLGKDQFAAELLSGIDFEYRTHWQEVGDDIDFSVSERGGLTRWLLYATLCLLMVELMMAWRFRYGFILLYGIVAAILVRECWVWNPLVGVILLVVACGGLVAIVLVNRDRSILMR